MFVIACVYVFAAVVVDLGSATRTTPTQNKVYPKPPCDSTTTPQIRYASTTERIYIESSGLVGGCVSVTDVWSFVRQNYLGLSRVPLHPIDDQNRLTNSTTGKWLLNVDLYVLDGITFEIRGSHVGGDADEFRLVSEPSRFINLRAHGGSLDIDSTKIFSWDSSSESYDVDIEDGRSYISCLSEVVTDLEETCEGRAKNNMGEGRMDITNSEIAYLGYDGSESWGLTWKTRGFCKEKTNPEVFGAVGVFGNMYDSDIHHNYYGQYSYGHRGGDWSNNTVHDNKQYGFDPHDYSTGLTIHDNVVYNNENHGIIASKYCTEVSIQGNEVYNSLVGIFLHLGGDFATVKNNMVHDNMDAGITLLESSWATITGNVFKRNAFGTRISVGSKENVFLSNIFAESEQYSVNLYEGSDVPQDLMTGRPTDNLFAWNEFREEGEVIDAQNTDGLQFKNNLFLSSSSSVSFEDSTSVLFQENFGLDESEFRVSSTCFDPLTDLTGIQEVAENLCDSPGKVLVFESLSASPTASPSSSDTAGPSPSPSPSSFDTSTPTPSPSRIDTSGPSNSETAGPSSSGTASPSGLTESESTPRGLVPSLSTASPTSAQTSGSSGLNVLTRRTSSYMLGMFSAFLGFVFVE